MKDGSISRWGVGKASMGVTTCEPNSVSKAKADNSGKTGKILTLRKMGVTSSTEFLSNLWRDNSLSSICLAASKA